MKEVNAYLLLYYYYKWVYLAITFQTVDSRLYTKSVYSASQRNVRVMFVCIILQKRKDFRNLCRTSRTVFAVSTRRRSKRLNTYIHIYLYIKFIYFTPYLYALFITSPLRLSSANAVNMCTFTI